MCGIAGLLGAHDLDAAETDVRRMIAGLTHRGPDGVRVARHGAHVLAHARLSIIDLEGGWQPLSAAGSTVIGNGEIYNYVELTKSNGLGDRLATGSDFEPLLHLYREKGPDALSLLRGMFGLCLIGGDGRVFLARDPFGIKPLYYVETDNGLAFASEPKVLAQPPYPAPEVALREDLLALGYRLGAPPFGVQALAPGEVVEWKDGALIRSQPQLPKRSPARPAPQTETEALSALDAVLQDSITVHQRSDVPYGLFLSGGVDSSIIASMMARLNSRPVTAFTCGFDAPGAADERTRAARVADHLGLDWREVVFDEEDFWRLAPLAALRLDDPTTDFACLPTLKLAEAAKGTLTVVLSGEGGDELFAGYGRYRRALRPAWLGGRAAEPQIKARYLPDKGAAALDRWRRAGWSEQGSRLGRAQAADIATWLPNDLLLKLDRMLMAEGLEGRTPFLDREVAQFAHNLPDGLKVKGRMGKWLLRLWLAKYCPVADPFARKQGFTVPVETWIAPRARDIGARLKACQGLDGLITPADLEAVFSDNAHAAARWPLIFTALWWNIHFGGMSVDEARAAVVGR